MKKVPLRRCVVSGETLPKKELLRIVRTPDGIVKVDVTGKLNGHGAYIKKDVGVLEIAIKRKTLDNALDTSIDASVYEEIRRLI